MWTGFVDLSGCGADREKTRHLATRQEPGLVGVMATNRLENQRFGTLTNASEIRFATGATMFRCGLKKC